MNKTAREMFEELGFNKCEVIKEYQPSGEIYHEEIKYRINGETIYDNYFGYTVSFILDEDNHNISRHYAHSIDIKGCANHNLIDMPLLQAINKQVEELNWNNDR